jgi:hypothetical protein
MDSTATTIGFLRTLTADGLLTSEETWSLGKFFIDHPHCAESWPGNLLAPMLESAFDDAQLNEEEMTLIADTIGSIEQEWRMKNPGTAPRPAADTTPAIVQPALIPVIDARFEIPIPEQESYLVALKEHTCTSPDCQQRKSLPQRHPGKCCKHVAYAFSRTGKVFEPWFQALLDDCFKHARGTHPAMNWLLLDVPENRPALLGGGAGPYCNVFASSGQGYDNYVFHTLENRWSYDASPESAFLIERAIRDNFAS